MKHTLWAICGLLAFALPLGSAKAHIGIFTEANCNGAYHPLNPNTDIADLRKIKYTYTKTGKNSWDQDISWEVTKNFNDRVRSVKIYDEEAVTIYSRFNFRGQSETLNDGNGCYTIGDLRNKVSSISVR